MREELSNDSLGLAFDDRVQYLFYTIMWLKLGKSHVIGFTDVVDLWVTKIKKLMILCARSTSRSREQRTKRRSRSENVRMAGLFYSQNNKIL